MDNMTAEQALRDFIFFVSESGRAGKLWADDRGSIIRKSMQLPEIARHLSDIVMRCDSECSEVTLGSECVVAVPLLVWHEIVERASILSTAKETPSD